MNLNKPLVSILSTAFLLASCESLPNIKISIEDNQSEEKTSVPTLSEEAKPESTPQPQAKTQSESEVATTTEPQPTAEVPQNSPNDNEPKPITQSASGITPQQLNRRVKQFTVRIDGASKGSGVIIDESDNTYTVLTNWHVVQESGQYTIQTSDGRQHQVNYQQVEQIPGVDLALVKFTSEQNYQIAEVGDSDYLSEGQGVHLAGYPGVKTNNDRLYRFYNLNIVGLLDTPINQGYSVLYEGETISGMSGSPLLDGEGHLVGIHGIYRVDDPKIRKGSSYAIPINTYKELVAEETESSDEIATQPSPVATKEDTKPVDDSTTVPKKQADNIIAHQEDANEPNSGIQEGQFVKNGLEGSLEVEIVKVKRIQNPDTGKRDVVTVSFRIKRIQEEFPKPLLYPKAAKTRNPDTFEEYPTVRDKHTTSVQLSQLPRDAWADAYFWSQVPEGVGVVDVIIPDTEIFKGVPIEG